MKKFNKLTIIYLILIFVLLLSVSNSGLCADKITLNLAFYGDVETNKAWLELVEDFGKRNPEIEVKTILIPSDEYEVKLKTMIAGGNAPDVMRLTQQNFSTFAALGVLRPIDDFLERDREKFNIDDIYKPLLEMWKFNGKYYGVPFDYNPVLMVYNKTMFEENGIKLPPTTIDEHWTIEEFLEDAKKLTKVDSKGNYKTLGFYEPYLGSWGQELWARTFGGFIFSDDEQEIGLNEEGTIKAFQFLSDLINVYKVVPPITMDVESSDLSFYSGNLAMQTLGHWAVPLLKSIEDFEWGFCHRPQLAGGVRKTVYGAGLYGISLSTKNADAAWKLAVYFASPEAQRLITKGGISMPVRESLGQEIIDRGESYEKLFPDALKTYAEKFPAPPRYSEMCNEIQTALYPVMRGEKTAEEVLPPLDKKLEEILKEAWEQIQK